MVGVSGICVVSILFGLSLRTGCGLACFVVLELFQLFRFGFVNLCFVRFGSIGKL